MATIGDVAVKLTLANIAEFDRGLKHAGGSVKQMAAEVQSAGGTAASMASLASMATAGAVAIAQLGAATIAWGVKLAAEMETAEVAFSTMLKSASSAKSLLGELKTFADQTPFEFPELRDAARQLLAFGFEAHEVQPELKKLGQLAAALQVPIGELANVYGKSRVEGRAFTRDIREFSTRHPAPTGVGGPVQGHHGPDARDGRGR